MADGEFGGVFNWKNPTVLRRRVIEEKAAGTEADPTADHALLEETE